MSSKSDKIFADIEKIASEQTERKQPKMVVVKSEQTNKEQQAAPTNATEFFTTVKPEEKKEPAPVTKEEIQPENTPVIGEKEIKNAGITGAFLAQGGIELLFEFAERMIFINRFSYNEKLRLVMLDELKEDAKTQEDLTLDRKFIALSKKHDKIKDKIPLNEKEIEALTLAFSEYTRATGKTMNPQLIIWATLARVLVGRSMEIFL